MSKYLVVGDVHATVTELDDCKRLVDFVWVTARRFGIVRDSVTVVFLGDLYHTHEVIRSEVLNFWTDRFNDFRGAGIPVIALTGNHDQAGAGAKAHAMVAHKDQITVVDKPYFNGDALFLPYMDNNEDVVKACNECPYTNTVICHATFNGAKYENGFYAPNGIDQNLILQKHIISGHVHVPQTFGKVTYVGAPRWRNAIDASVYERSIDLYDIQNGIPTLLNKYSTSGICSRIHYLTDASPSPANLPEDFGIDKYVVSIHGTEEYCQSRKVALARPGLSIRCFPETSRLARVKASVGIKQALNSFLGSYKPTYGIDLKTLASVCNERLSLG